jgi:cephalosporin-C deacetylase-like acetyl esterase
MGRPANPNSPAQAGRQALYKYLDDIAAKDEGVRRETISGITTRAQAELRQQEVRTRILDLMGGGFDQSALNAKVVGTTQLDGFRIEKVVYESQPKFYVTALLYLPDGVAAETANAGGPSTSSGQASPLRPSASGRDDASGAGAGRKLPAIVMAPGHASSGKAGDFAMASLFARNGFVVLSYDPIGQGERLQYMDPKTATTVVAGSPYPGQSFASRATGEHGEAGLQPTLIGDAVARYFDWDGVRAVDYLISRPEVDAGKIGAFGCSGGGAMTALLGAADKRVKAVATACYFTSFDALLPSIGAQDAEQSVPGFIASGFGFPDWIELAAPRAYAMVGTVSDMFPWAGFLTTAKEARRFYSLFDTTAEGVEANAKTNVAKQLVTPTGPTLNPDTVNEIPASSPFQVIAGIGGHGNLKPIQAQIVGFFLEHLAGRKAEEYVGPPLVAAGAGPLAAPNVPKGALQVTATGQVVTSYPGSETVFSLNLKRAAGKLPRIPTQTLQQVQTDVRMVTKAEAVPGASGRAPTTVLLDPSLTADPDGMTEIFGENITLHETDGFKLTAILVGHQSKGASPKGRLLLVSDLGVTASNGPPSHELLTRMLDLAHQGYNVLAVTPRPSPPGGEETKSPILGPFYMTELRAELVGKTILGMRVDDVIRSVTFLSGGETIDPANISVEASGHMGLVALHAAVLDARIKHVTVDHVLESYASLLQAPMPLDAPQDVLPGVLMKYDVPDLVRVLGDRVTAADWLAGTANLGWVAK